MFGSSPFGIISSVVFALLLGWAGASDIRSRRIPNHLVVLTAVLGIGFTVGHTGGAGALFSSLVGAGLGFVIWLPCYAMRMMGAGDVKFFAAASAWLGPQLVVHAAALSAIFGGVLALAWVVWRRSSGERVVAGTDRVQSPDSERVGLAGDVNRRLALPYGVAMAAGIATVAWFPNILR